MEASDHPGTIRSHRVLLVEDQPTLAEWVRATLEEHSDIVVAVCSQAASAVARGCQFRPSVILQDLLMPQLDGFALLERYRKTAELSDVPVVVLSALADVQEKSRAFELGAADYMVKVPHAIELVARVRAHSRAFLLRREREQLAQTLRSTMAELAESNVALSRVAREDGLTQLANRRAFEESLDQEWRRGVRDQKPLSFVLIDIDYFKAYNDRYGHVRGDECLQQVARVVGQGARRASDLALRYGGEEFGLLLPNTPAEGARVVAERVREQVAKLELLHEGRPDGVRHVTASVGVATVIPNAQEQRGVVVEAADAALYQAKRRGRDRVLHGLLDS
jgi:two-component system, chemotaxis family, response regulator WspR